MAFLDKLTELAVNVGDKANDALELSKLTIQQKNEEKCLTELKTKLGDLYLEMLRGFDEVPPEVQEVFGQICAAEQRLRTVTAEIERKRAEEAEARAGLPNYDEAEKRFCTQCGSALAVNARFCQSCGTQQN